ncbi:MAG: hypothetical protein KAX11_09015, partial [Candidatus Aminicenantes bacterium]|nr:hypothetical protein [Candidatus Aminicenantes bacterium]
MRSIRPKANYLLICLPVFMSIFLMLSCSDRKALSSGDLFPNLIQSGYLAQLMTFTQDEPLFIDASTAASSEGFTLNFQLEYLNLDSYYLFESDLLRDHNVVGVYPEVIFGEQSQILNDFWSQNEKQKMSLILKTPAQLTKETPVRTMSFLQINIPKENYRLQLENISLKAVKILSTQPENGTIIDQKTINFSWKLLKTDRLLDIKILLSRNKDFTAPNTIEFKTDNRQQSLTIHNNLENGKWYWKIELFHYRTRIACSEIWSFYVKKSSSIQSPLAQTKPIITNLDFFPIAIYGGAAANLKELRKIGFNAVQLSGHGFENTVELLNTAHRNGLKALLPLPPQD